MTDALRDRLLADLRVQRKRAELEIAELDSVGMALKHGLISVEQAIRLLDWEPVATPEQAAAAKEFRAAKYREKVG